MKDVQATEESPSPQKEHPAFENMKYLHFFFLPSWIRIRIQPTKIDADPPHP